jgi:hypothetical protein
VTYTFTFDRENCLTAVSGGTVGASFVYDADAGALWARIKGTIGGVTTVYIAGLYEYQGGATTHYYEGHAFRRSGYATNNGVFYLLQDHLGSNRDLIHQDGTRNGRNLYFPYGGNRAGVPFNPRSTQRFTGQYHEEDLPGGEGLSYYGARCMMQSWADLSARTRLCPTRPTAGSQSLRLCAQQSTEVCRSQRSLSRQLSFLHHDRSCYDACATKQGLSQFARGVSTARRRVMLLPS